MQLPGIAHNPEGALTKEMRDDIEDKLREAFWDAAEKKDVDPPEYLADSAKEMMQTVWGDMSDKEKFNWTKKNTDMLEEDGQEAAVEAARPLELPTVFDPMNETSGKDYQDTQRLAKYMADQRAIQLMNDRGLKSGGGYLDPWFATYSLADLKDFKANPGDAMKLSGFKTEESQKMWMKNLSDEISHRELQQPVSLTDIQNVDNKLWSGWKGSSSGTEGRILQVAAADELGGRLRAQLKPGAGTPQGVAPEKYQNWTASGKPSPVIEGMAGPGSLHEATTAGQTGTVNIHTGDLIYHDPAIQKFIPVSTAMGEAQEIGHIIDKQGFGAATPGTLQTAWSKLNDAQKNSVANAFYEAHPEFKDINQPSSLEGFKSNEPPVYQGEKVNSGVRYEVKLSGEYVGGSIIGNYATEKEALDYLNENYPEWKQKGWEITKKEGDETGHEYTRLPDLNVLRNGAASMTTDPKIANGWGGTPVKASQITREEAIEEANTMFPSIGGYEGVKAAVRAKWETTQYLLDRADMPVVQAYRGISMPHSIAGAIQGALPVPKALTATLANGTTANLAMYSPGTILKLHDSSEIKKGDDGMWHHATMNAPTAGTAAEGVINMQAPAVKIMSGPGNEPTPITSGPRIDRVVLRAEVPRTAVLSVPAYGINVHSEHEVVVTGTGWKGWDAWSSKAPAFSEVPMAGTTPSSFADKPQTTKDWAAIEKASDAAYHPTEVKINLTPKQEASLPALKAKIAAEAGYESHEAYEKAKATEKWAGYK